MRNTTQNPIKIPALASLRAFEAAARHLNFILAAEELGLTPSAVSHQIRKLESFLQTPLFHRGYQRVELTEKGTLYADYITRGFAEIRKGTKQLTEHREKEILNISAVAVFADRFLSAAINDYEMQHPELDVQLEINHSVCDFDRDSVDVGLRYGDGQWSGLHAEPLLQVRGRPACSPDIAGADNPLTSPADLKAYTLIGNLQAPDAWPEWLKAAGVPDIEPERMIWCDTLVTAIQAAISGQGLTIVPEIIVDHMIDAKSLFYPFDISAVSAQAYYFVCRPQHRQLAKIKSFHDWLKQQIDTAIDNTS